MRATKLAVVAAVALVSGAAAFGQSGHRAGPGPAIKWGPAPAFLTAGARIAVLSGDPSSASDVAWLSCSGETSPSILTWSSIISGSSSGMVN